MFFGRWLVLDQLHQLVLEHDLAGRRRDVDAKLERLRVGHRDLELPVAALDIVQQIVQAAHEILSAGRDRFAKHLRIRQRKVRRRQRVDVLAREEVNFLFGLVGKPFDAPHLIVQPARRDQIRLLDVIEQEVLLPVFVLEALVALRGLGDRMRGCAEHPQHRRLPQTHVVPPKVELRFRQSIGIREHLGGELQKRLPHTKLIGEDRPRASRVARREFTEQLRALIGGERQRFGQRSRIVRTRAGGAFCDRRCGHRSP